MGLQQLSDGNNEWRLAKPGFLGVDSFSNSETYSIESIEDNYIETVSKIRGLILNSIQLGIHIIMQLNRLL